MIYYFIFTINVFLDHQRLSITSDASIKRRKRRKRREPRFNSVSKIDRFSRVFFPFLFLMINLSYWWLYLLRSERKSTKTGCLS